MPRLQPYVATLQPDVPQVIHEWEKVAAAAVREGGEDDGLKTQMLRLAQVGSPAPAPAPECRSLTPTFGRAAPALSPSP